MFSCLHLESRNPNRYFLQCVHDSMLLAKCQCSAGRPTATVPELAFFLAFAQSHAQLNPDVMNSSQMYRVMNMLAEKYLPCGSIREDLNYDVGDATRLDLQRAFRSWDRQPILQDDERDNWKRQPI